MNLGDIEAAVPEGHAIGHVQVLCENVDLICAAVSVGVADGVTFPAVRLPT